MLYSNDLDQLAFLSPAAAEFVRTHDLETLPCGRHELGNGDYVNVMEYTSKDRSTTCYEAHLDFVDVQTVILGAEQIEVAPATALTETSAYDAEGDYALYDGSFAGERYLLVPGRFCAVLPEDAHMPGIAVGGEPVPVKKAVFKIALSRLQKPQA